MKIYFPICYCYVCGVSVDVFVLSRRPIKCFSKIGTKSKRFVYFEISTKILPEADDKLDLSGFRKIELCNQMFISAVRKSFFLYKTNQLKPLHINENM